ncbi:solute carrier family 24 [Fulvivirga imtechensis AK7]|uniref:Solute carrier family 24 n=1 Tax=Fulvivirga imtechensis AK7 TaxID=1237149 RepID=L8JJN8_9BACT|nr:calcium/sodium antiporter [Fulvivirga imtechensis]ELR69020.1 solute carrier family 24 [Fulvivirga imtechensis AK7]
MEIIIYSWALITTFYLLAEVSDRYFIPALDQIAKRLKMSHEMAGATLMAIGSSAPELFVAIIALVHSGNHEAIGVGTIVGSALFNILVIIGASAAVRKVKLMWQPVLRDLLFYGLSVAALFFILRDGEVNWIESLVLVIFYGGYLIAVMYWRKLLKFTDTDSIDDDYIEEGELKGWKKIFQPLNYVLRKIFPPPKHYIATFALSVLAIAVLCWILVESAIGISQILDIPEIIIALTVLAVGTSIPDMISSVIVAKQGRGGMAVSNAVGSNIFDILIGLGLPWLLITLIKGSSISTQAEGLNESVILLLASVLLIFIAFLISRWRIGQRLGYTLIVIYLLYIGKEIFDLYS